MRAEVSAWAAGWQFPGNSPEHAPARDAISPGWRLFAWLPSVADREVHQAVRCLRHLDGVAGTRSGGRRGCRNKSLGLPRKRNRAAVLETTLPVKPGQVDRLSPGCSLGGNRPAPAEQIGEVVQHQAELPVPDWDLESREAELHRDHVAGYRAASNLVNEDRVELRAACGVIDGE